MRKEGLREHVTKFEQFIPQEKMQNLFILHSNTAD